MLEQAFGTAHGDLFVARIRLAGQVVIRREMNDRGNASAVSDAYALECRVDPCLRGEIDADALGCRWRNVRSNLVKPGERVLPGQSIDDGRADKATASRNDDQIAFAH